MVHIRYLSLSNELSLFNFLIVLTNILFYHSSLFLLLIWFLFVRNSVGDMGSVLDEEEQVYPEIAENFFKNVNGALHSIEELVLKLLPESNTM